MTKRLVDQHGIDNLTLNPAMLRMLIDQLERGQLGACGTSRPERPR